MRTFIAVIATTAVMSIRLENLEQDSEMLLPPCMAEPNVAQIEGVLK